MKIALHVVGMFVFGAAALTVPAVLDEVRTGWSPETSVEDPSGEVPLAVLADGMVASAREAGKALEEGRRSVATHALDAAHRAAEAGLQSSRRGERFAAALYRLERARLAVQDGDVHHAVRELGHVRAAPGEEAPEPRSRTVRPEDYRGALLVDARGRRIGEVLSVEADEVTVRIGGWSDVMGLVDVDGETRTLSRDALLFGEPRGIGSTLVAAPLFGRTAPPPGGGPAA